VVIVGGLIPVFLLLATGVLARRWGMLNERAADGINRVVANIALPALLLAKVSSSPLEESFSWRLLLVTSGCAVLVGVLTALVARIWGLPGAQRGVLAQGAMRGNVAYVSFPVILAACGDHGLSLAAVACAVLIPVMNLLAVVFLEMNRADRGGMGRMMGRVAANPLVLATLTGLVAAALEWEPWPWLAGTLKVLGDFSLPASLLALGAQLTLRRARGLGRPTGVALLMKLGAMPALGWWGLHLLGATPLETMVGVLILAAPTAVASYPVAADLGGDTNLAGTCILATTLASFPSYLLWALLVR
jgi:predicted permease